MDYFLENNHCLQLFMTVTICTDVIPEKKTFLFISSFMELCTHPIAPLLNTEKYLPLLFSPLSPTLFVGEIKTGQIPVFQIISVSGPIQDEAKLFASVDGQKLLGANITLYTVLAWKSWFEQT